jgi:hypothetical protein
VEVRDLVRGLADKPEKITALNLIEDVTGNRISNSNCDLYLLIHYFLTNASLKPSCGYQSSTHKDRDRAWILQSHERDISGSAGNASMFSKLLFFQVCQSMFVWIRIHHRLRSEEC